MSVYPRLEKVYIRDTDQANHQCTSLPRTPLGFDLEWKPSFHRTRHENPVALVQLANKDTILLLQVSAMSEFPGNLIQILAAPDIVKVGVGIQYDAKKLYKDYSISTRNCVDLSLLARSVDNPRWKGKYSNPIGLARLVEAYEELILLKGPIRCSNWEALLTDEQQQYAASDAHSGFAVYTRLIAMAATMTTIPHENCYSFDCINGRLCERSSQVSWFPHNPDYDPGPPPPPRIPKPPRASDVTVIESPPTSQRWIPPAASHPGPSQVPVFVPGRGRVPTSQPHSSPQTRFRSVPQFLPQYPADNQPRYRGQHQPNPHPQTRFLQAQPHPHPQATVPTRATEVPYTSGAPPQYQGWRTRITSSTVRNEAPV